MNTLATDLQNSFTDDDDVSVLFMTVSSVVRGLVNDLYSSIV